MLIASHLGYILFGFIWLLSKISVLFLVRPSSSQAFTQPRVSLLEVLLKQAAFLPPLKLDRDRCI